MSDNAIQPPPGYTSEPPTEEGWYRLWKVVDEYGEDGYSVTQVLWSNLSKKLVYDNDMPITRVGGCFWGPKVRF